MAHIFDPVLHDPPGRHRPRPADLASNIIEGLGGSIRVHSTRGAGTEIAIDLPLTAPGATA